MTAVTIARTANAPTIDRRIYGQFAEHLGRCVYEGLWVGPNSEIAHKNGIRTDVIAALKHIKVPVVRWPGGCFADEYHWLKGVGTEREPMYNTHWGGVVESNEFGTHEYFELLNQLDAEAYINGNVGSGTVAEMQDWIEYMTLDSGTPMAELRKRHGREQPYKVEFFGVGNESWGCGGNMRPDFYADLYRQFQTYVRQYGDSPIVKIACGANSDDYGWTEALMSGAADHMSALTLHYYTLPTAEWQHKGAATGFTDHEWHETIRQARRIDEMLARHTAIMDRHDPARRIGLFVDEWGTWYDVEPGTNEGFLYQQNTMRDAVVAAITFNTFHRFANRVRMANIAQMVNVLQAMILTDGARMLTTPTYHVFDLYTCHQDAEHVPLEPGAFGADVDATCSYKDGAYAVSFTNTSLTRAIDVAYDLPARVRQIVRADVLHGGASDAHNTFDAPNVVRLEEAAVQTAGSGIRLQLPPHSVTTVRCEVAE